MITELDFRCIYFLSKEYTAWAGPDTRPPLLDVTAVASYLTVNVSRALHPEVFIQTPLL